MKKCCLNCLGCKTAGAASLAFCIGVVTGFILPPTLVIILETAVLIFLGYLCLFKW